MTERNTQPIPIAQIDRDGQNHRVKVPGDKEAIRLLAESMNQHLQLSPVAVLHLPDRGRYLLIFGFRRVAAAELLGWMEIAAEVFTDLDPATVMHMRAVENLDRKDLNPIEEAVAVAQLLDAAGGDVGKCAASIGRSESWVRDRCYLQRLGKKTRQMVIDGRLLLGHAREIAKLPDADVQETLADWCKVGDDGTCHRRLDQLRRDVENRMNSLKVVPWNLEVDFAGKPACSGCAFNSSNDRNLFEHDEPGKAPPEAFCMSPGCYEAKQKASEKALEKAVNKIVNQGAAATEKAVGKAAPDFLKTSRVVREVKKVRGEDVEREGKPKEERGTAPKISAEKEASILHQSALTKWEDDALRAVTSAARTDRDRMIALTLLGETKWSRNFWANNPLDLEGRELVQATASCDLAAIVGNIWNDEYEPPAAAEMPSEGLDILIAAWGITLPNKPTLEEFLNPKQPEAEEPGQEACGASSPQADQPEPPASEESKESLEETFRKSAAEATEGQLKDLLKRIATRPNPDGVDPLRKQIVEAEIERRKAIAAELVPADPDDELEALDLPGALAAKLRRHDLHTIDAIRRAGGGDCTKLIDLPGDEDRFGPREVTSIRKAMEKHEKKLASQVVGPACDTVPELQEQ